MMRYRIYGIFLFLPFALYAQNISYNYQDAYNVIDGMLQEHLPLNFKKTVIATENAYHDGQLDIKKIENKIDILSQIASNLSKRNLLLYDEPDRDIIARQAVIFKVLKDTTSLRIDSDRFLVHTAYTYDFDDMWGKLDWSKMFVSKLLFSGKGNCHSLPYLYKILADELHVPAYLAFAPNHIYIKSYSKKMGWYNTELTSGTFPVDAWLMASGYISVEAVSNGLYMDTLSNKQAVANCLVDLAQGYQHKFGKDNPDFVVKCCNTCLKYHPTNVNAMLTKAEAEKYFIQAQMKAKNLKKPQELFADNSIKQMYEDLEQTYVKLHQLGYRRMPEEMYMKWLNSLKTNTAYQNSKVSVTKK